MKLELKLAQPSEEMTANAVALEPSELPTL
jgi:hypothetical protein